ncbi:MAG TPA: class I SAM-dependent methyltransferase [Rhizomicrobium sp.]
MAAKITRATNSAGNEDPVQAAVQQLYSEGPERYAEYRARGDNSPETLAWRAVDAFVQEHSLSSAAIIDLGCGYGADVMRGWRPASYVGYDVSQWMLDRHVYARQSEATLRLADLNEAPTVDLPRANKTLILSVLALHYLRDPANLIQKFAKPGRWFCFLVANAESDRSSIGDDGVVRLQQGTMKFTYFAHELSEYVAGLNYPSSFIAQQCGGEDKSKQQPYYLLGGRW